MASAWPDSVPPGPPPGFTEKTIAPLERRGVQPSRVDWSFHPTIRSSSSSTSISFDPPGSGGLGSTDLYSPTSSGSPRPLPPPPPATSSSTTTLSPLDYRPPSAFDYDYEPYPIASMPAPRQAFPYSPHPPPHLAPPSSGSAPSLDPFSIPSFDPSPPPSALLVHPTTSTSPTLTRRSLLDPAAKSWNVSSSIPPLPLPSASSSSSSSNVVVSPAVVPVRTTSAPPPPPPPPPRPEVEDEVEFPPLGSSAAVSVKYGSPHKSRQKQPSSTTLARSSSSASNQTGTWNGTGSGNGSSIQASGDGPLQGATTTTTTTTTGELDFTLLIEQLYVAADRLKREGEERRKASERIERRERDLRDLERRRDELERAAMAEARKESEENRDRNGDQDKGKGKQKEVEPDNEGQDRQKGKATKRTEVGLDRISRGVQADYVVPSDVALAAFSIPIASTSSTARSDGVDPSTSSSSSTTSTQPTTTTTIEPKTLSEYHLVLTSLQSRLAQLTTERSELDHRYAVLLSEKGQSWPAERAVVVQRMEKERRDLEKRLDKALKRVEVLEKERPAPVLRIGGGPPNATGANSKRHDSASKGSHATTSAAAATVPDHRLARLEARVVELSQLLSEATARATEAEESLAAYEARTDALLETQQTTIASLEKQLEKGVEQVRVLEGKVSHEKRVNEEQDKAHQTVLRERKKGEDEARNDMLRYKDELKRVQGVLDQEIAKGSKDLAASERKKIELKWETKLKADKEKHDKALEKLRHEMNAEKAKYEVKMEGLALDHNEILTELEDQLQDETQMHQVEVANLRRDHALEIKDLKDALAEVKRELARASSTPAQPSTTARSGAPSPSSTGPPAPTSSSNTGASRRPEGTEDPAVTAARTREWERSLRGTRGQATSDGARPGSNLAASGPSNGSTNGGGAASDAGAGTGAGAGPAKKSKSRFLYFDPGL
ncbi:hypothetical protein JCM10212_002584 [Sporobolomyces blumeae]